MEGDVVALLDFLASRISGCYSFGPDDRGACFIPLSDSFPGQSLSSWAFPRRLRRPP